ncbi:hypothetical protein XH96_33580 [Bradyrhizobium sp. CCBAU 51765]|nr:hypothetical protein XH96_33580 [Bradyrhizobium sp. CCBAU 51765]
MSVRGKWRVVETPDHDMAGAGSEPARGRGWAEELADGSLEGEICLEGGDDIPFIARRSATSSTAC